MRCHLFFSRSRHPADTLNYQFIVFRTMSSSSEARQSYFVEQNSRLLALRPRLSPGLPLSNDLIVNLLFQRSRLDYLHSPMESCWVWRQFHYSELGSYLRLSSFHFCKLRVGRKSYSALHLALSPQDDILTTEYCVII